MPQRPVSDTHQPDSGVLALFPETLRRDTGGVGEGVVAAVHVDGDDLSAVIGVDQGPDTPLEFNLEGSSPAGVGINDRIDFQASVIAMVTNPRAHGLCGRNVDIVLASRRLNADPWCFDQASLTEHKQIFDGFVNIYLTCSETHFLHVRR